MDNDYRRAAGERLARLLKRAATLHAEHSVRGRGRVRQTVYRLDGVFIARFLTWDASSHYDRVISAVEERIKAGCPRHPSPLREANLVWMCVRRSYPSAPPAPPPPPADPSTSLKSVPCCVTQHQGCEGEGQKRPGGGGRLERRKV